MAIVGSVSATASPGSATGSLSDVVHAVRGVTAQDGNWELTSRLAAEQLRRHLPGPEILTGDQREGDPAGYLSHLLHTEPDGSFSIVAMVWLPGQLADNGGRLVRVGSAENQTGQVSGFAPPGDIHRVRNIGRGVTISLHIYGADISRLGCSIRREYDLPIS